jgi:hypothetical protein
MVKKSDKSDVQKEVTSTGLVFDEDYIDNPAIKRTLIESLTFPEPEIMSEPEIVSEPIPEQKIDVVIEEDDIKAIEENFSLVAKEEIIEIVEKSIPKINPKSFGRGKYRVMLKLGKI